MRIAGAAIAAIIVFIIGLLVGIIFFTGKMIFG